MARRLLHALIIVLTLVIGATAAVVIVTQTAWFKNWLRVYIEREANLYLNGQMSIGRLGIFVEPTGAAYGGAGRCVPCETGHADKILCVPIYRLLYAEST